MDFGFHSVNEDVPENGEQKVSFLNNDTAQPLLLQCQAGSLQVFEEVVKAAAENETFGPEVMEALFWSCSLEEIAGNDGDPATFPMLSAR
ncbi:hypothetical protein N7513_012192 [Penicillium frequentans]|nr:hypothetical protein N7513_012192 [Penicillium glabrum]